MIHRGKEVRNTYRLPKGKAIRLALRKWFRSQRKAVLGWLGNEVEQKLLDWKCGDAFEYEIKARRDIPVDFIGFDDFGLGDLPMADRMTALIEAEWDKAGGKFASRIGLDPNVWEVTSPKIQDAINNASLKFCRSTNETTALELNDALDRTRRLLGQGLIDKGESIATLTKMVKDVFGRAETWRARRIAASEASRAHHAAEVMVARESGVVTGFRWLLSEDACSLCQTISRRVGTIEIGKAFAVVGDNPDYSRIEAPPLHPNCQCSLEEIMIYDEQPGWGKTLHNPEPEKLDY